MAVGRHRRPSTAAAWVLALSAIFAPLITAATIGLIGGIT